MNENQHPLLVTPSVIVKTIICINDRVQVQLNSDLKTGKKLEDDDVLRAYLGALIEANVLKHVGIRTVDNITSIQRLDFIDSNKSEIALYITTSVQQDVEHVQCHVKEERICIEDNQSSEDSSSSGSQQVPDVPVALILKWNSLMTRLLIQIRGDMDQDFRKTKYKFHLWERLAAKMNLSPSNVKVTAKDCDDKWRNIVATYRKNIEKMKIFGDNSVRWSYFEAMDKILKETEELTDTVPRNVSNDTLKSSNLVHSESEFINEPSEMSTECNEKSNQSLCIADVANSDSSDAVMTNKQNGDQREWTTEECLTFISLRHIFDKRFKSSLCTNQMLLWRELVQLMNAKFSSDFDSMELKLLWDYLTNMYRKNLENLKSQGLGTVKWKYFAIMDEVWGGTKEIADICTPRPGDHLLDEFNRFLSMYSCLSSDSAVSTPDIDRIPMNVSDNENESDSSGSLMSYSGTFWTKNMVKLLISLRKNISSYSPAKKLPAKKQWILIARKLQAIKKVKITEEACEEKWRYLVQTYKKKLIARSNGSASVIRWPHFWKMREILGDTVLEENLYESSSPERKITSTQNSKSSLNDDTTDRTPLFQSTNKRLNSLTTLMTELRDNQNRVMNEVFEYQRTKIDEIQSEQRLIKTLLMQVLHQLS